LSSKTKGFFLFGIRQKDAARKSAFLHMLFLENEEQPREKITGQCFSP